MLIGVKGAAVTGKGAGGGIENGQEDDLCVCHCQSPSLFFLACDQVSRWLCCCIITVQTQKQRRKTTINAGKEKKRKDEQTIVYLSTWPEPLTEV